MTMWKAVTYPGEGCTGWETIGADGQRWRICKPHPDYISEGYYLGFTPKDCRSILILVAGSSDIRAVFAAFRLLSAP